MRSPCRTTNRSRGPLMLVAAVTVGGRTLSTACTRPAAAPMMFALPTECLGLDDRPSATADDRLTSWTAVVPPLNIDPVVCVDCWCMRVEVVCLLALEELSTAVDALGTPEPDDALVPVTSGMAARELDGMATLWSGRAPFMPAANANSGDVFIVWYSRVLLKPATLAYASRLSRDIWKYMPQHSCNNSGIPIKPWVSDISVLMILVWWQKNKQPAQLLLKQLPKVYIGRPGLTQGGQCFGRNKTKDFQAP